MVTVTSLKAQSHMGTNLLVKKKQSHMVICSQVERDSLTCVQSYEIKETISHGFSLSILKTQSHVVTVSLELRDSLTWLQSQDIKETVSHVYSVRILTLLFLTCPFQCHTLLCI